MADIQLRVEGSLSIVGDVHTVQYEPGEQTGSKTIYLQVSEGERFVPIFIDQIDQVIEMLKKGKLAIQAIEGEPLTR